MVQRRRSKLLLLLTSAVLFGTVATAQPLSPIPGNPKIFNAFSPPVIDWVPANIYASNSLGYYLYPGDTLGFNACVVQVQRNGAMRPVPNHPINLSWWATTISGFHYHEALNTSRPIGSVMGSNSILNPAWSQITGQNGCFLFTPILLPPFSGWYTYEGYCAFCKTVPGSGQNLELLAGNQTITIPNPYAQTWAQFETLGVENPNTPFYPLVTSVTDTEHLYATAIPLPSGQPYTPVQASIYVDPVTYTQLVSLESLYTGYINSWIGYGIVPPIWVMRGSLANGGPADNEIVAFTPPPKSLANAGYIGFDNVRWGVTLSEEHFWGDEVDVANPQVVSGVNDSNNPIVWQALYPALERSGCGLGAFPVGSDWHNPANQMTVPESESYWAAYGELFPGGDQHIHVVCDFTPRQ